MLDDRRGLLWSVCFCLSVCLCTVLPLYNSPTITSIKLKFGGQILPGVQMNSSKFGVICLKSKVRREFLLFSIGHIQRNLILLITYVNQYFAF